MFKIIYGFFSKPIQEQNILTIPKHRMDQLGNHFVKQHQATLRNLVYRQTQRKSAIRPSIILFRGAINES